MQYGLRLWLTCLVTIWSLAGSGESSAQVAGKAPQPAIAPFDAAQAKVHQKAWADHLDVPVESTNSIGMKMVLIPPGEFTMGSPASEPGRPDNETQHTVTLSKAFTIGVYEVTQSQYEEVMGSNPSIFKGENRPVEMVSWEDAVAFCEKLSALPAERATGRGYSLLTGAEWEYACRAGTTTVYSCGDDEKDFGEYAWFGDNSGEAIIDSTLLYASDNKTYFERLQANKCTTQAVGEKLPNGWGLYDMHGNVWEMCSDVDGSRHVVRGGGWCHDARDCRTARRGTSVPPGRSSSIGFRLAMSLSSVGSPEAEQQK